MIRSKTISLLLVFAHLIAVFQFTVPYLTYYANYTYFSEVACINKDHPELHCNGHCQLQKMIKHEHKHAGQNTKTMQDHTSRIDFFFQHQPIFATTLQNECPSLPIMINESVHSLFFGEPTSPPPQYA